MTAILCKWLNEDIRLESQITPENFESEFANGYLIGQVLSKYSLQNDFESFSKGSTSESKLNNFMRIEPTLALLDIPLNTSNARDIMYKKHGVAVRLLYQLYIALNNKEKRGLTGTAIETMKARANVALANVASIEFKRRLTGETTRQSALNLHKIEDRFNNKKRKLQEQAFKRKFEEEEQRKRHKEQMRQEELEKFRTMRQQQTDVLARIRAAAVRIPKPPDSTKMDGATRAELRKMQEAATVKEEIEKFERSTKNLAMPTSPSPSDYDVDMMLKDDDKPKKPLDPITIIQPAATLEYVSSIQRRVNDNSAARKEREKRRRRVLLEQMQSYHMQEEAYREDVLVSRLMRQSQHERKIAVQLMHTRRLKDVILKNRIEREKDYTQRRLKDFDDALNREAKYAHLAKLEYQEQLRKESELHKQILNERAERKYQKHYSICQEIMNQIIDFSIKIGEYKELTENKLPAKLMKEWTTLFTSGVPLYNEPQPTEEIDEKEDTDLTKTITLEEERRELLDEADFMEYKHGVGEWSPPDAFEFQVPPKDNAVLGHIIQRLFNIVSPPEPPVSTPEFPEFPIKACFLGKQFSGKTTAIEKLSKCHRITVLIVDVLVNEAVDAFEKGELDESKFMQDEVEEAAVADSPDQEDKKDNEPPSNSNVNGNHDNEEAKGTNASSTSATTEENKGDSKTGKSHQQQKQSITNSNGNSKPSIGGQQNKHADITGTSDALLVIPESDSKASNDSKRRSSFLGHRQTDVENFTTRAKLGFKAAKSLKRGKAVEDQVLVDIVVEAIHKVEPGTGWILDDFPSSYNQAKLLEKALTGYDPSPPQVKTISQSKGAGKARKKSLLAPDPKPEEKLPPPISGIDVVVLFDVKDEIVLKRAAGRTKEIMSSSEYHEEFNPPPEGSRTGINKQEKALPIVDLSNASEHVQQRLTGFHDTWSKLEKWFTKFGNLRKADAALDAENVFKTVEGILEEVLEKLKPPPEAEPSSEIVEGPSSPQQMLELNLGAAQPSVVPDSKESPMVEAPKLVVEPAHQLPAITESETVTTQGEKEKVKGHGLKVEDTKDSNTRTKEKGKKGKSKKSDARRRSSATQENAATEASTAPGQNVEEDIAKAEEEQRPPSPPKPEPGSEDWIYVEQSMELELASILTTQWETIEISYINTSKYIFRQMREERDSTYRYFYNIRNEFKEFLHRPDLKQMLVNQWQKEYNELAEDMRGDEETKAELHQTIMDLTEKLWSMCDKRKEGAEREREGIMKDGWLDDRIGLLTNYYVTLMQSELDRVQDTCYLLKDYYMAMAGKILIELTVPSGRLPLVELTTIDSNSVVVLNKGASESGSVSVQSTTSKNVSGKEGSQKESRGKERGKDRDRDRDRDRERERDKDKDAGDKATSVLLSGTDHENDDDGKTKIPLLPRRPKSAEQTKDGQSTGREKKEKKSKKEKQEEKVESPSLHMDPDEKIIHDAYNIVLEYVQMMVNAELTATAAEAEKEREREHERQRDLEKAAKSKKKQKKEKEVKGRHKKQQQVVEEPVEEKHEQTAEEKEQAALREKIRQEFTASTKAEEIGLKSRLELIRSKAITDIQALKHKAETMYKDMDDWLGQRFRKEMESIKDLITVMKNAVEREEKLLFELKLVDDNFFIDENVLMYNIPEPPPPPSPVEATMPFNFTVVQLINIFRQFHGVAPSGFIIKQAFVDLLNDLISLSHGQAALPDKWVLLGTTQLNDMANLLSLDKEYINWRTFIVSIMNPIPWPSRDQLLDVLKEFRQIDSDQTGYVTEKQYQEVQLWFTGLQADENEDPNASRVYDRLGKLKEALFEIFADTNVSPPLVDYVDMLLYFCQARRPDIGLMRALSVASCQPMPYISIRELLDEGAQSDGEEKAQEANLKPVMEEKEEEEESQSETRNNAMIPIDALVKVLNHAVYIKKKSNRFETWTADVNLLTFNYVADLYQELGSSLDSSLPFDTIFSHPILHDSIKACKTYKKLDFKQILATTFLSQPANP